MRRRMLMDLIFGGDSVKYEGTFTGNGTQEITIPMDFEPDYIGKIIPDEFVVGYGLDYDERFRELPFVGVLKPEVYEK